MSKKLLHIALVGDRNGEYLPHVSAESIIPDLALDLDVETEVTWIPTGEVKNIELGKFHLIWAGSGPYLDADGVMIAIRFARENKVPFIGTCSGFKYTIIESARNVCEAEKPDEYISFNESCGTEYKKLQIEIQHSNTLSWYGASNVIETSHCRFEINPLYQTEVKKHFTFAGTADDGRMVIAELSDHPFFIATLFLPQLNSQSILLKKWMHSGMQLL